ncbi:MAG TPA: glycosyltransferase family 4 protein [Rhizomicrobium sp.]|jgi:glycosyltransferase involved in cell wall biosynthesis|nr:glycosyltransferase family 4 protein [Rhizomicrobium sp.]
MRVLLVSDVYPPEIGSATKLMSELADEVAARGHAVTVLTGWPFYKLAESHRTRRFSERMMEGAVQVLRVQTLPLHNSNFITRGFAQLFAPYQFWRVLKKHESVPFDAVLVYSPPLPLASVGAWAKREGARFVLNVQDIFPQNAIDLGILKNPLAIALFRWIERRAYMHADVVTAHSDGNRALLAAANPSIAPKLTVLHNWVDMDVPSQALHDFRETFGLKNKFIAVYGGVTGPAQGLEVILDLAGRVRDLSDLVFLIVGEGTEKAKLEARAKAEGLDNVVFRPFVAQDLYPSLLMSCDVGFLTLSPKMKTPVVPGKILGYMAMSLPVLAIVNRESDAHAIVHEADCGYACYSDDPDEAEQLVRKLYARRGELVSMGSRGRAHALTSFSKSRIVDEIEALLGIGG